VKVKELLKNYKAIFVSEILTFILISFIEVALGDQSGGQFGGRVIYGLPTFSWIFSLMVVLFFLIPAIITRFNSKLIGAFTLGYLIGSVLENFFWFMINPSFGLAKFSSSYVSWLSWVRIGYLEVPEFYLISGILSIILWFIFIKHSKKIDKWLK